MAGPYRAVLAVFLAAAFATSCSTDPDAAKREYLASGDRYLADGKLNEAIVQYRNALQQDPKFGEARYRLAEAYAKSGDIAGAYREHIRAADLLPNDVDAQIKAAAFLLAGNQFEDAKDRARKAIAIEPSNAKAHVLLGNALAGLRDFDEGLAQLEEAARLKPSVAAYGSKADLHLQRGETDAAEASFKLAIDAEPTSPEGHVAYAQYLLARGWIDRAEETLKHAVDLDANHIVANRSLAQIYLRSGKVAEAERYLKRLADAEAAPHASSRFALVDLYVASRRNGDALKLLETIALSEPAYAEARARAATIIYAEGRTAEARRMIDELLIKYPRNAGAHITKARFLQAERQYDAALVEAKAAVAIDNNSVPGHLLCAQLYQARNDRDQAIASYRQVLRLNPQVASAHVEISRLSMASGEFKSALDAAEAGAANAPSDGQAQLALARALLVNGEVRRAVPIVGTLVKLNPGSPVAHSLAGTLALAQSDYSTARRSFEHTLKLDRANIDALSGLLLLDVAEKRSADAVARIERLTTAAPDNLGLQLLAGKTYAAARDFPKAEAAARRALELDSDSLAAYSLLGEVLVATNRLDLARAEFERIVERQPESVSAHTVVAMVYELQRNKAAARQRYERILQIDPRAAVAANNLAYLYAEDGGNLDVALQLAQTAKQQLPDMHEVDDTLAWVYVKKALPSMAIPILEQCVKRQPKNPYYLFHLGLAYAGAGEKAKARQSLQTALGLAQKFEASDAAQKALDAL